MNRQIKFRFYDKALSKMIYRTILPYDNVEDEKRVVSLADSIGNLNKVVGNIFENTDLLQVKETADKIDELIDYENRLP